MGDYGKRVFFLSHVGAQTKRDAGRGFLGLFQPGNIVALPYASDGRGA
jgi:hypothetical protein